MAHWDSSLDFAELLNHLKMLIVLVFLVRGFYLVLVALFVLYSSTLEKILGLVFIIPSYEKKHHNIKENLNITIALYIFVLRLN